MSPRLLRRVHRLIYLSGTRATGGYTVHCGAYEGMQDFDVTSARVGFALVRTLRGLAIGRPDHFPPSRLDGAPEFGVDEERRLAEQP